MRKSTAAFTLVLAVTSATAQTPPASAPTTQKSLAASLNVYVFPSAGQDSAQQGKDETECYNWAVQNSGHDPIKVAKEAAQPQSPPAQQSAKGAGARGAVKGAAAGAVIGEIADDDAGEGAAIGAAAGAVGARRRAKKESQQTAAKQEQAAAQASTEKTQSFNKAFSACLEGKKYTVKF